MFIKHIRTIEIDPTGLCNLKCTFCPRSTFYPNTNDHMSLETAKTIVSQLQEINYTGSVSITGKGEPTLHNNFDQLVELFSNNSWSLKINTNGKRFDQYRDVILDNFDLIHFNCYEYTEQQYKDKAAELAEYGNVRVKWRPGHINWFDDYPRYTNRAGSFDTNQSVEEKRCDVVFTKLFIDYNGVYRLCCEDWKDMINMGNIFDEPIIDYVENNPKLKKYREMLAVGNRDISPCNKCMYSAADRKYGTTYDQMVHFEWLTKM